MRLAIDVNSGDDWGSGPVHETNYYETTLAAAVESAKLFCTIWGKKLTGCTIVSEDRVDDEPVVEVTVNWYSDSAGWLVTGNGAGDLDNYPRSA